MPDSRPRLATLRQDIDEIDAAIHDLIMRRSRLVAEIAAAKGGSGLFLRPGREAQVVRRILQRHQGNFPAEVLARIWREIISTFTAMQGPFSVAAFAPDGKPGLARLARDHFGSLTPVTRFSSEDAVLQAVTDKAATVGLLPLPGTSDAARWWCGLAAHGNQGRPRIIARLPFVISEGTGPDSTEALVVSLAAPEESGDDCSLLILEADATLSKGDLQAALLKACLSGSGNPALQNGELRLVELEGFLTENDPRLGALTGAEPAITRFWFAGSYARPLKVGAGRQQRQGEG